MLGRREAIDAATRDTFSDYVGRWYLPERMVVGVGGRIDGDLMGEIETLLGDVARNGVSAPVAAETPERRPRLKVQHKDSDQAHVCIGAPSYPLDHPDRYALNLVATVLGGGMSSRLFTEVRERRGLAYYVFGVNNSYTDTGSLYSQAGVDINRIDEAITTIRDELRRIADEAVPADELEKARAYAKGRFVLQTESPQGMIAFGLRREVLERQVVEPQEVLDGLDTVTAGDVQRVAQDVLGDDGLTLAVIGPFEDEERFEKLLP